MYKIRFSHILPVIQATVAMMLLNWWPQGGWPQGDFPYPSIQRILCFGINAPATVLSMLVSPAWDLLQRQDHTPPVVLELYPLVVFIPGVIVLWYFVGRAIDNHIWRAERTPARIGRYDIIAGLFYVLMVFALLGFGLVPVLHGVDEVTKKVCFISWAAILTWRAGVIVARLTRRHTTERFSPPS